MPSSTLDLTGEQPPVTTLGHGTEALGPSDSSDSGSDIAGGPGMDEGLADEQSREMPETIHATGGRDIGDFGLTSDSDGTGTGERAGAGVEPGVANDQTVTVHPGLAAAAENLDDVSVSDLEQVDGRDLSASGSEDDADADDDLDDVPVSDGAT